MPARIADVNGMILNRIYLRGVLRRAAVAAKQKKETRVTLMDMVHAYFQT